MSLSRAMQAVVLLKQLPEPVPAHTKIVLVPGPIDNKGLAFDRHQIDKTPETTVVGEVAVVSHHEQPVLGHADRSQVVAGLDAAVVNFGVLENGMSIVDQLTIDEKLLVADLHNIAGNTDDALDEILAGIFGKLEDDNVVALRIVDGDDGLFDEGRLDAIDELVDQNVIADQQRVLHGTGRDFESLDHKGADKQGQYHGDDDRLDVFPQGPLFFGGLFTDFLVFFLLQNRTQAFAKWE